jgi:alkylhydroperoxidase/carboxymuconolactone decarboxylase family protein
MNEKKKYKKDYFDPDNLKDFAMIGEGSPELWEKFLVWYNMATSEGEALTAREKCLIALAVATAIGCPFCVDAYTKASLSKGADKEEMTEAIQTAAAITGGATLVRGVQMVKDVNRVTGA